MSGTSWAYNSGGADGELGVPDENPFADVQPGMPGYNQTDDSGGVAYSPLTTPGTPAFDNALQQGGAPGSYLGNLGPDEGQLGLGAYKDDASITQGVISPSQSASLLAALGKDQFNVLTAGLGVQGNFTAKDSSIQAALDNGTYYGNSLAPSDFTPNDPANWYLSPDGWVAKPAFVKQQVQTAAANYHPRGDGFFGSLYSSPLLGILNAAAFPLTVAGIGGLISSALSSFASSGLGALDAVDLSDPIAGLSDSSFSAASDLGASSLEGGIGAVDLSDPVPMSDNTALAVGEQANNTTLGIAGGGDIAALNRAAGFNVNNSLSAAKTLVGVLQGGASGLPGGSIFFPGAAALSADALGSSSVTSSGSSVSSQARAVGSPAQGTSSGSSMALSSAGYGYGPGSSYLATGGGEEGDGGISVEDSGTDIFGRKIAQSVPTALVLDSLNKGGGTTNPPAATSPTGGSSSGSNSTGALSGIFG